MMHTYPSAVAVGVPVTDTSPIDSTSARSCSSCHDDSTRSSSCQDDSACSRAVTTESEKTARASAALHTKTTMPPGLCDKLAKSTETFPLRIMIVDNSGSMNAGDGTRLVPTADCKTMRTVSASRWQELADDVASVARMSIALGARTDFHFLNPRKQAAGFGQMSVGPVDHACVPPLGPSIGLAELSEALKTQPGGSTPLTESVMTIVSMLAPSAAALRARGEQVCVIIATDGLPNDSNSFMRAMHELQKLPVWCVVRLCTNDDSVVDYWNGLDAQLEAPLEVLDDVRGEAEEVYAYNKWLTYAPALHSARLFGLPDKLFDEIDESKLLPSQIKQFIEDLLGSDLLPEPELDPKSFYKAVQLELSKQPMVYDPRGSRMKPWIDVAALEKHVRSNQKGGGDCIIC